MALAQCDPPPGGGGGGGGGGGVVVFYSLNGQTVQADASGGFLISNVAVVDVFPADNVGDDLLRITAVRVTDQGTEYCYVDESHPDYPEFGAFRMRPGDTFPFPPGLLTCTPNPPPLPESIVLVAGCDPNDPATCGPVIPTGQRRLLSATATLPGGVQQDVTLPSQWTSYRTSNANIARVIPDDEQNPTAMLVEALSVGTAFITATNGGATSVEEITVIDPANAITTTVEGFVQRQDGSMVDGASVTVQVFGGAPVPSGPSVGNPSWPNGFFSIPLTLPDETLACEDDPDTSCIVVDATIVTSVTESGSSPPVAPIPNGITDAGVITIETVCDTPWSTAFGPTTLDGGAILAFAVFDDDGPGPNPPALFVGGEFNVLDGGPANRVAKWNGQAWEPLVDANTGGNGVNANVHGLSSIDLDGPGGAPPRLYVAGEFIKAAVFIDGQGVESFVPANKIAAWDGSTWSDVGVGVGDSHATAHAVAAFDDETGNGTELYVGGDFAVAGGYDGQQDECLPQNGCVFANNIAKWNPTTLTWSAVGTGLDDAVLSFAAFDEDGLGPNPPALFAGGKFGYTGTTPVRRIARWDGLSWTEVGYEGLPGFFGNRVTSLTVFDDGSGAGIALYAGGQFINPRNFGNPDPVTVNLRNIARWDGSAWSALGNSFDNDVLALAGLDDGGNRILYASGQFLDVDGGGGPGLRRVAQWDGTAWSAMGTGLESRGEALAVFDDGSGAALYVGGAVADGIGCAGGGGDAPFNTQGYVAKWIDQQWSVLSHGLNDEVKALVVHDDGAGPALFAGGMFTPPKGPCDSNESQFPSSAVARFDGALWSSLGAGMDCVGLGCVASVHALAVFDEDASGPNPSLLFAGGAFAFADGVTADNVARWDGTNWSALAGGGADGTVEALAIFDDDGAGANPSALYAGGSFSQVGTVTASRVARWDGINWSALGGGVAGGSVFAMAAFDDGNGPMLYVGGDFTNAGGVPGTANLARWDGSAWSAVGTGVTGAVHALYVFDADADGPNPPALYAGGAFLTAGGITVNRIARWDGVSWSPLGDGLGPTSASAIRVDTLRGFDNGSGPFLYAGGDFQTAGGSVDQNGVCVPDTGCIPVNRLAKWNPILDEWSAVGVSSQKGSDPGGGVDTCTGSGCEVRVNALTVFDDGANGPALFAAGAFETAAGAPSSNIAKLGCR